MEQNWTNHSSETIKKTVSCLGFWKLPEHCPELLLECFSYVLRDLNFSELEPSCL